MNDHDHTACPVCRERAQATWDRDGEWLALWEAGKTYAAIARMYGYSKERVRQVVRDARAKRAPEVRAAR